MRAVGNALLGTVLGVVLLSALPPSSAAAQDLEVVARQVGIDLPQGYWDRKAADPLAFELPNGLFGRRTNLPPTLAQAQVPQRNVTPYRGEARFPVILALFADSEDPAVTPAQIEQSLFSGPAPKGTLTEFYEELSLGAFTVTGDVLPWVRTSLGISEVVGTGYGLGSDGRTGEYLLEALNLVDADVDFRHYDNDGPDGIPDSGDDDGIADVVTFEFQEGAASCGGPAIWPHRWGVSGWNDGVPWASDDLGASGEPIQVDAYIIQGATNCGGDQVQIAATIAHEFGHVLGLPDYYHAVGGITPENRRWVLGCWELMAAGAWGCGPVGSTRSAFGPTHMTAWNRYRLGWLDFEDVGAVRDTTIELDPIRTTGRALRIPLDRDTTGAVLLVEYRDHQGFDRDTPGAGVLVTRIDPGGDLRPEEGYRYFASLLEADGDRGLFRVLGEGGDRGSPGDAFGGPGAARRLNALTSPSTRSPSGVRNAVAFHDIVAAGGRATLHLSTSVEPELLIPGEPLSVVAGEEAEASFLVAGGVLPLQLTVEEGSADGLTVEAVEDRVRLSGVPLFEGPAELRIRVTDVGGRVASGVFQLLSAPFQVEWTRLVSRILGTGSVTPGQEDFLDRTGNGNGYLDVGDLRARRFPGG